MRGHNACIDGLMRLGSVAAQTFDLDLEQIGGRKERARANAELTCGNTGPVVHAIDLLDAPAVHHAIFAHLAPAAAPFFGGLKDHHDRPVKVPRFGQILRRAQKHRRVAVVAAGVHRVGRLGGIVQPGLLVDRQRVHICAQPDDLARRGGVALDHADNAGTPDAFDDFVTAKGPQLFSDGGRGAMRLKQDFGVFMQVTSPCGDVGVQFGKSVLNGHFRSP